MKCPNTVSELLLVAEYDRRFSNEVSKIVRAFFESRATAVELRETVYRELAFLFDGYIGSTYQATTSKAVMYFAMLYSEQYGTERTRRKELANRCPTYSILQSMMPEDDIQWLKENRENWKSYNAKEVLLAFINGNTTQEISNTSIQEKPMSTNAPIIETKTFIRGAVADTLSDDQIFGVIATIEREMDELEKIKTKPISLKKRIEDIQLDLQRLVAYVDQRGRK